VMKHILTRSAGLLHLSLHVTYRWRALHHLATKSAIAELYLPRRNVEFIPSAATERLCSTDPPINSSTSSVRDNRTWAGISFLVQHSREGMAVL
jgi:hypothetical protein